MRRIRFAIAALLILLGMQCVYAQTADRGEVRVSHIMVATEEEARTIIASLEKGADFATIAKERSTDPAAKLTGGDLGFVTKEELAKMFLAAAFELNKGEITKTPIKTPFGWHVAKVTDRRLASAPTDPRNETLRPGQVFRDCADCPEMVVIPTGTFTMGSPRGEKDRREHEGPQRQVSITRQFALAKFEVTREAWAAFVRDSGYQQRAGCFFWNEAKRSVEVTLTAGWRQPGFPQTDRHPVVCVSWDDANAYAVWLRRKTGKTYRLPTEAEWEYAARAGTQTSRPWGNDPEAGCRHANGLDASFRIKKPTVTSTTQCDDGYAHTSPVGSFQANRFGLHDMIGNVHEWVEDCWNNSYVGAPGDSRAWLSGDCNHRVVRGGSWYALPGALRSAYRGSFAPSFRDIHLGFRLARTLD